MSQGSPGVGFKPQAKPPPPESAGYGVGNPPASMPGLGHGPFVPKWKPGPGLNEVNNKWKGRHGNVNVGHPWKPVTIYEGGPHPATGGDWQPGQEVGHRM